MLIERLRVRLGREHEVVTAFRVANDAALAIYHALGLLRLEPETDTPAGAHEVARLMKETRQTLETERATFDARRDEFMDAAQRAAGASLPPSTD